MAAQTVLITGCSAGGIGEGIALALAKKGYHVFATARNPRKISEALSTLSNVTVLTLDVTSTESVAAAARSVAESGRGLDVLVNNAGIGSVLPILDLDLDEAQRLFDTNFWGVVRTVQAFSDLIIARRGRIVNISSVGAALNVPWICACFLSLFLSQEVETNNRRSHVRIVQGGADGIFRDAAAGTRAFWRQCRRHHGGNCGVDLGREQ